MTTATTTQKKKIEATTIYEATNILAEYCLLNRYRVIGVTKTKDGSYIGEYVIK
jgi:hypothetical protein